MITGRQFDSNSPWLVGVNQAVYQCKARRLRGSPITAGC